MKKVIVFDLDDTLAVTKSPISDRMGEQLSQLLAKFQVCVISGGKFEQFKMQVVDRLSVEPKMLENLHLMPTCGTRYYRFDSGKNTWDLIYEEDLTSEQKSIIIDVLTKGAKKLGIWEDKPTGEIIEDRGSQITYSALGQKASPEDKYKWDPDGKKKWRLRDYAAPYLSDVEVRVGGTTSVDVTRIGVDKGYGVKKLMEVLKAKSGDILFIGDKLQEGGNDYPVKALGIECIEVEKWEDTALVIETLIKTC